ncbi:Modification methylase RsrI [compost metagenome]
MRGNGNSYDGYGEFKRIDYTDDGSRYPHSIVRFSNAHSTSLIAGASEHFHPTQKPLELFCWLIKSYSSPGDLVFDGYCGSGTTAIACLQERRRFICSEIDPTYFRKSMERLNRYISSIQKEDGI